MDVRHDVACDVAVLIVNGFLHLAAVIGDPAIDVISRQGRIENQGIGGLADQDFVALGQVFPKEGE
jgi:hypothetical protein